MNAYIKTKFFRQSLVIFAGIPLLIWAQDDLPVRSLFKESLTVLTILAFSQMLGMFFWSGINPNAVKEMKMNQVVKFHKIIGYTAVATLLVHPVFLVLPRFFESGVSPVDAFVTIITTFNQGIILGIVSWCLILIIGITCLTRKRLPVRYTTWRNLHGMLAVVFVSIVPWHVLGLGRHSSLAMSIFIILSAAGGILLFGKRYIVKTITGKKR